MLATIIVINALYIIDTILKNSVSDVINTTYKRGPLSVFIRKQYNDGYAFGVGKATFKMNLLFLIGSTIYVFGSYPFVYGLYDVSKWLICALCGGYFNCLDRYITKRGVVDYVRISLFGYSTYVFNITDVIINLCIFKYYISCLY